KQKRALICSALISMSFILSLMSECICNDRPLYLSYEGKSYFPFLRIYPASVFGQSVSVLPDYKKLVHSEHFTQNPDNWALFSLIPYGVTESDPNLSSPPTTSPSKKHWLGTDDRGRDLLTRLLYGFRNSMLFAISTWAITCLIGF